MFFFLKIALLLELEVNIYRAVLTEFPPQLETFSVLLTLNDKHKMQKPFCTSSSHKNAYCCRRAYKEHQKSLLAKLFYQCTRMLGLDGFSRCIYLHNKATTRSSTTHSASLCASSFAATIFSAHPHAQLAHKIIFAACWYAYHTILSACKLLMDGSNAAQNGGVELLKNMRRAENGCKKRASKKYHIYFSASAPYTQIYKKG